MGRSTFVSVLALLAVVFMAGAASATVLTFEEIFIPFPPPQPHPDVPDGYGGLHWAPDFHLMDTAEEYPGIDNGWTNGTISGQHVAFNGWEADVWVEQNSFDFNGAWLTAAWNDNLNITVDGWLGATLLYSNTVVAQCTSPQWFEFDYLGIDLLTFDSFGGTNHGFSGAGTHFVMDDMVINEAGGPVVPAPAALMSLVTGLVCLGGFKLRRKA